VSTGGKACPAVDTDAILEQEKNEDVNAKQCC
jgi:hypothetical protein